jgi:hypothetical protein
MAAAGVAGVLPVNRTRRKQRQTLVNNSIPSINSSIYIYSSNIRIPIYYQIIQLNKN